MRFGLFLSPIVEEADESKAHTMAQVEELGRDNIQKDSHEETNSTSVVKILRSSYIQLSEHKIKMVEQIQY
jgi:hypothetical protein